jgi:hypothetical protein
LSVSMAILEIPWAPFELFDPGPLIKVIISATNETIEMGRSIGLEFPKPQIITALLDTGSPFTVVNRTLARNQKLPQTDAQRRIRTLAGQELCDEHSCSISFPDCDLPAIETIKVLSGNLAREPFHSCIIGRDVLRNWLMTLDGRNGRVTIKA